MTKEKLNVDILKQPKTSRDEKPINTKELEVKIKEIAKEIRSKVRKDEPR